jgi:hypothetical protein
VAFGGDAWSSTVIDSRPGSPAPSEGSSSACALVAAAATAAGASASAAANNIVEVRYVMITSP